MSPLTLLSQRIRPPLNASRFIALGVLWLAAGVGVGAVAWAYRDIIALLLNWTPALARGFALNILMGVVAMLAATVFGTLLGCLQVSLHRGLRQMAVLLTQFLRNAPWLVVVFLVMNLLPFEFQALDRWWQIPDWLKAALGLGLAGSGYVSEIVRGGIRSIPVAQWEAAASLALPRRKSLRLVILPQALRSMVPPWMSLYCAVTMATSLANLMGVEELMTSLQLRLTGQTRPDLLLPAYLYVFVAFFIYIYPISRYSRYLERKWSLYS